MGIGILGTGACMPERVVTNSELCAFVPDATPEWILSRTAIETRRYAADDEATSDLASRAAARALDAAGLDASRVDYLIVSTSTGDYPLPPTSCLVQDKIGARDAACFDINAVCSGFVFALEVARGLISASPRSHALVIGADLYSRFIDFSDRRMCVLFGDGAGAAVIGAVPPPAGIVETYLGSYGDACDLIKMEAGGSRMPASAQTVARGQHVATMRGRQVRDFVFGNVPPLLAKLLGQAGVEHGDVDCFIPHQANGMLLHELVARCGLERAHTHRTVERYGNLGSASLPVTLDDAVRTGSVRGGDLVLLAGFGGGMAAAASLIRWSPSARSGGCCD